MTCACSTIQHRTVPKDPPVSEEDIKKIVDEYVKAKSVLIKSPSKAYKHEEYRFRLLGQLKYLLLAQLEFRQLSAETLRRLPIYLIKQLEVQVEFDSLWFWGFTSHLVDIVRRKFYRWWPTYLSFQTLMASHFVRLKRPKILSDPKILPADTFTKPQYDFETHSYAVHGYLCYPTLEGLLKYVIPYLVDFGGRVLYEFHDGFDDYRVGRICSSIAALLRVIEINPNSKLPYPNLSDDLKDCKVEIENLSLYRKYKAQYNLKDGWDLIYRLRNWMLHGQKALEARSALVTNLICMILCHLIEGELIEEKVQRVKNDIWYNGIRFFKKEEIIELLKG